MADTKEKEPKQAGQAGQTDPEATPQGQEPKAADVSPAEAPAAPKPKQKEKQAGWRRGLGRRPPPWGLGRRPGPRLHPACTTTTCSGCGRSSRNSSISRIPTR